MTDTEAEDLRKHYHVLMSIRFPREAAAFMAASDVSPLAPELQNETKFLQLRRDVLDRTTALAVKHHRELSAALGKKGNTAKFMDLEDEMHHAIVDVIEEHHFPGAAAAADHLSVLARRAVRQGAYKLHAPLPPMKPQGPSWLEKLEGWLEKLPNYSPIYGYIAPEGEDALRAHRETLAEYYLAALGNSKPFAATNAAQMLGSAPEALPEGLQDHRTFQQLRSTMMAELADAAVDVHLRLEHFNIRAPEKIREHLQAAWETAAQPVLQRYDVEGWKTLSETLGRQLSEELYPRMQSHLREGPQEPPTGPLFNDI